MIYDLTIEEMYNIDLISENDTVEDWNCEPLVTFIHKFWKHEGDDIVLRNTQKIAKEWDPEIRAHLLTW